MNALQELNIEPIKLLRGSHPDTGETGQGCFMNVASYLNGDSVITDRPSCVCEIVRAVAISVNDNASDEGRQKLLPFVLRAMGSDGVRYAEYDRRREISALYFKRLSEIKNQIGAAVMRAHAAVQAMQRARLQASVNPSIQMQLESCAASQEWLNAYGRAQQAEARGRAMILKAGIAALDAMLPPAQDLSPVIAERAARLAELAGA